MEFSVQDPSVMVSNLIPCEGGKPTQQTDLGFKLVIPTLNGKASALPVRRENPRHPVHLIPSSDLHGRTISHCKRLVNDFF
jgi:hypothetical protein